MLQEGDAELFLTKPRRMTDGITAGLAIKPPQARSLRTTGTTVRGRDGCRWTCPPPAHLSGQGQRRGAADRFIREVTRGRVHRSGPCASGCRKVERARVRSFGADCGGRQDCGPARARIRIRSSNEAERELHKALQTSVMQNFAYSIFLGSLGEVGCRLGRTSASIAPATSAACPDYRVLRQKVHQLEQGRGRVRQGRQDRHHRHVVRYDASRLHEPQGYEPRLPR